MPAINSVCLLPSALIPETVFQWPGMGMLFFHAVTFLDIPLMAAYLCFFSFFFFVLNTLVDVAYAVIDPRLRTAR